MYLKFSRLSLGLLFFGVFLMAGCGFQSGKYFGLITKSSTEVLQSKLDAGNRLFNENNYQAAEKIFLSLQDVKILIIKRQALYGLACTRLRLAENRREYFAAVQLLDQWRGLLPASHGPEDPRMLLPFFTDSSQKESGDNQGISGNSWKSIKASAIECEKENETLRRRLRGMEKQLQELESQADSRKTMEIELETLRNQIKSIETIDQKIQEKKQGISPP